MRNIAWCDITIFTENHAWQIWINDGIPLVQRRRRWPSGMPSFLEIPACRSRFRSRMPSLYSRYLLPVPDLNREPWQRQWQPIAGHQHALITPLVHSTAAYYFKSTMSSAEMIWLWEIITDRDGWYCESVCKRKNQWERAMQVKSVILPGGSRCHAVMGKGYPPGWEMRSGNGHPGGQCLVSGWSAAALIKMYDCGTPSHLPSIAALTSWWSAPDEEQISLNDFTG